VSADSPFCPSCGAFVDLGNVTVSVSGTDAREVETVSRALVEDAIAHRRADQAAQHKADRELRGPWLSGLFYLVTLVVVVALLLTIGRLLPLWALPIVVVGAALLLAVVGAFQLRQDKRLAEKNFLSLMQMVLARLPLLIRPKSHGNE
jgi:hypothetical protein